MATVSGWGCGMSVFDTQDYFNSTGFNSGSLSDFWQGGPDQVLMAKKPSLPFEMGKAFERLVYDASTGEETFFERFFVADVPYNMPEKMPYWIGSYINDCGFNNINMDDLSWFEFCEKKELYVRNKPKKGEIKGALSKTKAGQHTWLDACQEHPGKYPISMADYENLTRLIVSLRVMRPRPDMPTLGEILSYPTTEYQKAVYWKDMAGNKHKALFDVVSRLGNTIVIIDLKWTGNLATYESMFRQSKWIQSIHYRSGMIANYSGMEISPMYFVVGVHQEPYKATMRSINPMRVEACEAEYQGLVAQYAEWARQGKKPLGYFKFKYINPYLGR